MTQDNGPKPVTEGSVFAALITEMIAATQELNARRKFCEEAGEFLKEQKMVKRFEKWCAKRHP